MSSDFGWAFNQKTQQTTKTICHFKIASGGHNKRHIISQISSHGIALCNSIGQQEKKVTW